MSVTAGNFEFFYDRGKDVFSFRKLPPDNECGGWTQEELEEAADIAYEGHSRLELGLDWKYGCFSSSDKKALEKLYVKW